MTDPTTSLVMVAVLLLVGTTALFTAVLIAAWILYRRQQRHPQRRQRVRRPSRAVVLQDEDAPDPDDELTIVRFAVSDLELPEPEPEPAAKPRASELPTLPPQPLRPPAQVTREDDVDRAIPIVADPGAADDEPTQALPLVLVSAAGQTDRGLRRKRNEDHLAIDENFGLYVVADGMGGHAAGEVASKLACETLVEAFRYGEAVGEVDADIPRRAAEVVLAIQLANREVFAEGQRDPELRGMGTTLVCARFAPRKQRVYIGHVGDSRCYRLRDGQLRQLTIDHTMARFGVGGRHGEALSRAIGVGPGVNVDLIIAETRVDDVYLLCSDGLTKMVRDEAHIRDVLLTTPNPDHAVERLVAMAKQAGGKDNVTVLLVAIKDPAGMPNPFTATPAPIPRHSR